MKQDILDYLAKKQAKAKQFAQDRRAEGKTTDAEFFSYASHLYAALIGEIQADFHKGDVDGSVEAPTGT